jgi:sporulation protein YlmC with PRC-barrel domain
MATSVRGAVISASTLTGSRVRNRENEDLGKIEDIMLDPGSSRIAYAVLSFGGFLGMGDKHFAIPWDSLEVDSMNEGFILNVDKQTLEDAPGFDKNDRPDFTDRTWGESIHQHYRQKPYWT